MLSLLLLLAVTASVAAFETGAVVVACRCLLSWRCLLLVLVLPVVACCFLLLPVVAFIGCLKNTFLIRWTLRCLLEPVSDLE